MNMPDKKLPCNVHKWRVRAGCIVTMVCCPAALQLSSIGLPNEETYRRELREMLFTAPDIDKYISGVVSTHVMGGTTLISLALLGCAAARMAY